MESSDSMELFLSENRFLFCVLLCSHAPHAGMVQTNRKRDPFFHGGSSVLSLLAFSKKRSWEVPFSIIRRSRDAFCNIR